MSDDLKFLIDWASDILEMTDPDDPESYFNDHPRECCEAIATDVDRERVAEAISNLRAVTEDGGAKV